MAGPHSLTIWSAVLYCRTSPPPPTLGYINKSIMADRWASRGEEAGNHKRSDNFQQKASSMASQRSIGPAFLFQKNKKKLRRTKVEDLLPDHVLLPHWSTCCYIWNKTSFDWVSKNTRIILFYSFSIGGVKLACDGSIESLASMMVIECVEDYLPFESQGWIRFPAEDAPPHAHDGWTDFRSPVSHSCWPGPSCRCSSSGGGNITIKPTRAPLPPPPPRYRNNKKPLLHTHYTQLLQCGIMS